MNLILIFLKCIVEFLGTFMFLSIIVNTLNLPNNVESVGPISVAIGLLASIFFGARVTGGHFNPAVTIMMAIKKVVTPVEGVYYVTSQVLGGIAAAYFDTLVIKTINVLP